MTTMFGSVGWHLTEKMRLVCPSGAVCPTAKERMALMIGTETRLSIMFAVAPRAKGRHS